MINVIRVTLKGVFRDRIFHGIFMTAVLFLFIPAISSLSMRQVSELCITVALSLVSFILLLLSVFLGGVSLWREMERRYTYSVLSLPLKRSTFLLGKFGGIALFLLIVATLLAAVTSWVVMYAATMYPPSRPIVWAYLFLAIYSDLLKYILLVAVAFLFSTVSTSFFLPIFGTVSIFLVGSATQEAYDFIHTSTGQNLPQIVKSTATILYFVLPNFSAFDLKVNAIYGVKVSEQGLFLTLAYFVIYTTLVLFLASTIYSRREMQ